jgi:CBS domain-containing protein
MPTVQNVLQEKGNRVHTTSSGATVAEAVRKMNENKIGALVVRDGSHVVGMFTERDVLRRVVGENRSPADTIVAEVMTSDVIFCRPDTDLDEIAGLMKSTRVRHVPVVDQDQELLGLISMGDVNAAHASTQESTISFLNDYIYGRA